MKDLVFDIILELEKGDRKKVSYTAETNH